MAILDGHADSNQSAESDCSRKSDLNYDINPQMEQKYQPNDAEKLSQ